MKKLIAILTLFYSLTALGQNGVKGDYFLLINSDSVISLNTFENSAIVEHKTFDINEKSIFTTDKKSRVAILDTAKNSIVLYDFLLSKETKLTIPYDLKPKTLLLFDNNLFVGGEMGKEILIQYQIKKNQWEKLEVPEEVQMWGKAVDELVINDSLLIAIDNLILPKYILYYDLESEGRLELSHFKRLKYNSSYESIHDGRITSKYLGLISTTMNHGSIYEHITIYSDLDLIKSFAISVEVKQYSNFNDLIIVGDKLFIAHRNNGLGVFEVKDSYFKASKDKFDNFNNRVKESLINYKKYKKGEIIRLTIIPNTSQIILTIRNSLEEITNEIVEI
ncbi:hypothetical protein [Marinifilum caeruleilacunae]|uniref:Uncharacterized protein n=1 Tax=Marinifilum caeruleilacunae TaxID=2499076 RepID=A0ABX1X2J7_9BACT|nr:hypothetical protein [Marinifilum caeruleilacunae]NOU62356.1 hypothetical protein [Marinifilum caeruleilacunae]